MITGSPYGPGACGARAACVDFLSQLTELGPAQSALPEIAEGSGGRQLEGGHIQVGFFKNFSASERWKLQFRAEFFNIFNRVNLGNPVASVTSAGFGSIASAGDPRIGQMALKITF